MKSAILWIFVASLSGSFATDPFPFFFNFGCYEDSTGMLPQDIQNLAECMADPQFVPLPCTMVCFYSKIGVIDHEHKNLNLEVLKTHYESVFKKGSNNPAKLLETFGECYKNYTPNIDWDFKKRGICKQSRHDGFINCMTKRMHCGQ